MSKIDLNIKDETFSGNVLNEIMLTLESEFLKVQDIIQARVYKEVEKYNNSLPEYFNGLVQPTEAEITLNGFRLKDKKKIDPEKQFYVACEAFQKNAFFILIDYKQATTLEDEVFITRDSEISFVKLTPLVGG